MFVSPQLERAARAHAQAAEAGHVHDHGAAASVSWRERCARCDAWAEVGGNFRGDWAMLYKEIGAGFLIAGFVAQLGDDFFNGLFIQDGPGAAAATLENVIVGPLIAVLSFVCSVGNVPLAAVLWSGGISFAGVLAFLFADLIVLPIVLIYRKYYGTRVRAADLPADAADDDRRGADRVAGVFELLGLIPDGPRPQPRRRVRHPQAQLQVHPERRSASAIFADAVLAERSPPGARSPPRASTRVGSH